MPTFEIKDMTCGHCVSTITKAVKAEDKDAKVSVDLQSHRVEVESSSDAATIQQVISQAGYTPVPV